MHIILALPLVNLPTLLVLLAFSRFLTFLIFKLRLSAYRDSSTPSFPTWMPLFLFLALLPCPKPPGEG